MKLVFIKDEEKLVFFLIFCLFGIYNMLDFHAE